MTHKEYIKLLLDIREAKTESSEKLERLSKIYEIKPVSLLWNVIKAEIILESGMDVSQVYELLSSFLNMDFEAEGNIEGNLILQRLDEIAQDDAMGIYREYEVAQCRGNVDFLEGRLEGNRRAEQLFLKEENSIEVVESLANEYLASCKIVSYYILERYKKYLYPESQFRAWVEDIPNMGFLKEAIDRKKEFILCVGNESEYTEIYILGFVLAQMGCKVFLINSAIQIDVEANLDIQNTVMISMENVIHENGIDIIPSLELIYEGDSLGNNVAELIRNLVLGTAVSKHSVLLAASYYIEQLAKTDILKRNLQNLYIQLSAWKEHNITFAWVGSYASYIGDIYGLDVEKEIHKTPECRFSIVIPARNSSATLRHTLNTCLNQRYKGSYEIIISDNSSDGNTEIYRMVQEINDKHIKYFRTPRELHLPKSFEYAFLKTSGEYILSIGSDDALLPWTLEVLDDVICRYPDEEIMYWERGFYAWPGFNGGQENQFVIPRRYQKGQYNERYINAISFLTASLKTPANMYAMPLLYINSMFRRSYFDTLLVHTGRLWDGICQDLYMGVVTSLIVPRILCLQYPLSIAGMSSGSVGATSNAPLVEVDDGTESHRDACVTGNIGGFAISQTEVLFPEVTTDVSSLYNCFLRAVARGLLPQTLLEEEGGVDWKSWFMNCYKSLSKQDIYYGFKMQKFRFSAMKHGKEFLKWFDETIGEDSLIPVRFLEPDRNVKTYREQEDGESIVLDASKKNVHNVYEASLLFEKLSGL